MTLAVTGIVSATVGIWMIGGYALVRLFANVSVASSLGRGITVRRSLLAVDSSSPLTTQNFNEEMSNLMFSERMKGSNDISNNMQEVSDKVKSTFGQGDSKVTQ